MGDLIPECVCGHADFEHQWGVWGIGACEVCSCNKFFEQQVGTYD